MSIGFLKFPEIFYPVGPKNKKVANATFLFAQRLGFGSGNGADVSASAAVDAQISVDLVLAVTLGDSGHGAALSASAASDASIGNLVSHDSYLLHISTYVEVDVMIHLYTGVSQHLLITN
jgi:hypothetical protein